MGTAGPLPTFCLRIGAGVCAAATALSQPALVLDPRYTVRLSPVMRRLASALLLLLQLGPLAGAAVCMRAEAQPKAECAMPMQGMTHENGLPHSAPTQDCALMVVCAPAAPVVPVAIQLFGVVKPTSTDYSTPASLFPGEPIAPPQPPPIV